MASPPPRGGGLVLAVMLLRLPFVVVVLSAIFCQSAASLERHDTISSHFARSHVVGLIGTGKKWWDPAIPITKHKGARHEVFSYGWRRSNKSCGIDILLHARLARGVARLWAPPSHLAGRLAALRKKGDKHDFNFILFYFPTSGSMPEVARLKCITQMVAWVSEVHAELPARTTAVLLGDVNDGIIFLRRPACLCSSFLAMTKSRSQGQGGRDRAGTGELAAEGLRHSQKLAWAGSDPEASSTPAGSGGTAATEAAKGWRIPKVGQPGKPQQQPQRQQARKAKEDEDEEEHSVHAMVGLLAKGTLNNMQVLRQLLGLLLTTFLLPSTSSRAQGAFKLVRRRCIDRIHS